VARERRLDLARRRRRQRLATIGDELREARLTAGLSQDAVARAAGTSSSALSRVELGGSQRVSYETLVAIGAILGLDVSIRAYPEGSPLRDTAQLSLLSRFRARIATSLSWRSEVPLSVPGDRRGWDAVIAGPGWRVAVDAETRLRDVQALLRRIALKARDDRAATVILVVADTRHNRQTLRLYAGDIDPLLPERSDAILSRLEAGDPPPASGIVRL
jgi:transcriptional regulator with XRE-family HTH domain